MKKNILILYSGVGHGHKSGSENIANVLQPDYEVDLVDLFDLEGGKLVEDGSKLYLWIIRNWPGLWRFFYLNKVFLACTLPFRTVVAGWNSKKVLQILKNKKYDAVICAHANASAIVSYLKSKHLYEGKFIITFTDFHLHRYWIFNNADFFLINTEEQKQEMIKLGTPVSRIAVCGTTVPEVKQMDISNIKVKFGVSEKDKVLLILGGAAGFGINPETIVGMAELSVKIFIVCGTNKKLFDRLQKFYGEHPHPAIKIFGYIDFMQELYAIANLVVTKPGGLTTSECLTRNIPILVLDCIPGGEEQNYNYLLERKLILPPQENINAQIARELATGEFAESLKHNIFVSRLVRHGQDIKEALTKVI